MSTTDSARTDTARSLREEPAGAAGVRGRAGMSTADSAGTDTTRSLREEPARAAGVRGTAGMSTADTGGSIAAQSLRDEPPGKLRSLADLPRPRGLPLVGNMLQVRIASMHRIIERWCSKYGSLFRFHLASSQCLVVADTDVLTAVLRDRPDGFRRSDRVAEVAAEMGLSVAGVFSAEGDEWRKQRRMVMASFDPAHIKAYFPALLRVAERLRGRWQRAARAGAAIDLQADLMRYTVDAVAGLAFGTEINTLESDDEVIQRHLDQIFPALMRRMFSLVPYWRWFKLPADRRLERSVAAISVAIEQFIAQARARLQADPALREHPRNLLEAMIVAADQPDSGLNDAHVGANVLTMLLAGEDTTANSLAWLIYLLERNPGALQRAQAEVRGVVRSPAELAALSLEQLGTLEYLDACVNESMRLKPVAPFLVLQALRAATIKDVHVPAGTYVWCVMRHASVAESNLANAGAFDPARWLSDAAPAPAANAAKRLSMPFGAGPRMCPGRYLALVEIKLAMTMLLSCFDIESVKTPRGADATERLSFTMAPVGLQMRLRERS
jgi:cytochrome P450